MLLTAIFSRNIGLVNNRLVFVYMIRQTETNFMQIPLQMVPAQPLLLANKSVKPCVVLLLLSNVRFAETCL